MDICKACNQSLHSFQLHRPHGLTVFHGTLQLLKQHAPDMPLHAAYDIAHQAQRYCDDTMFDGEALAILCEKVLTDEIMAQHEADPAVTLAIKQAQYRHGWVVCGPTSDAMAMLLADWAKKATDR